MTKDNIKDLLKLLEFEHDGNIYTKRYHNISEPLKVDISNSGHIYYNECGIIIGRETTCNLLEPENLVVLHCVDRLLWKGYKPIHIELEPAWKLGHSAKGGYADIWVRTFKNGSSAGSDEDKESLLIIECKTWGREFDTAWTDTKEDGAQLFSYFQQERATQFLCLYTADIIDGEIKSLYHLINVQDNVEKLANDESAKSYKEATNNKQLYSVWHETYHDDYATRGLFEREIEPYKIGKNKYTTNDLKSVDNDTIQKKYNEFALILRQHNVGGHENAFDKLVNLFLAKVVDETNNPNDLNFYWKGSSYDDDYQLQDRLQRLYRDGMKRFLNEDVTYIENSQIEKAFRRFKNDPDATKKTIMEYFRALKFFSDNDFSFISVHNKRLFEQNAAILLKIVKMLQDIKLKDSDQNQLLGDLFEGFLNKGVKQSEGQFFTPMPIVRFLVSSLPLEQIVKDIGEIPNVIDYACGAGHFLTEYAIRIKDYVNQNPPVIPLKDYYAHITGIEKEYRLSKVSKVSAFMYGHDETNIIYADALVPNAIIKEGFYDILIANPPYSVKGFLETLTESQRRHYTLFNEDINIGKNNAIETFFIERASQLLKAGGVAGIILPVSVLNKDGIYARAREIILQKFDIVALVEFGSGTFGKTGTNTVMMFLRRKETNTPDAEHYRNRVESWFKQHHEGDETYEDKELLIDYCEHCGYEIDEYMNFLSGFMSENFMQNEIVQAYKDSFFGNQRNAMKGVCDKAKDIRTKFKNRQCTQAYRRLSENEKKVLEQNAFMLFVKEIEKEKVYYFILAKVVPNSVVIVKSPSGTTDRKHFLGYEWSDSKGNEGIKYLNVVTQNSSDDEENAEDDDTIRQIRGINDIKTPLFNPKDLHDDNKINSIIRKNFISEFMTIPEELNKIVTIGNLIDMIDFSSTTFNLGIKTNTTVIEEFESKFPLIRLGNLIKEEPQYGANESAVEGNPNHDYRYIRITDITGDGRLNDDWKTAEKVEDCYILNEGDILFARSGATAGKVFYYKQEYGKALYAGYLIRFKFDTEKVLPLFVYDVLSSDIYKNWVIKTRAGMAQPNINAQQFASFRIPVPPLDIQQKIVSECEDVNKNLAETSINIEKKREKIKVLFDKTSASSKYDTYTIENLSYINKWSIDPKKEPQKEFIYVDIDAVEKGTGVVDFSKKIMGGNAPSRARRIGHKDNIIISTVRPNLRGFAYLKEEPVDTIFSTGFGIIEIKDEKKIIPYYLYLTIQNSNILMQQILAKMGRGQYPSINESDIKLLKISVPPIKKQKEIVEKIVKIEKEITEKIEMLRSLQRKTAEILDKYLK